MQTHTFVESHNSYVNHSVALSGVVFES